MSDGRLVDRILSRRMLVGAAAFAVGANAPTPVRSVARAHDAEPSSRTGPPTGETAFAQILARVPDPNRFSQEPVTELATYADISAQPGALGLPRPTSRDDDEAFSRWGRGIAWLAVADPVGHAGISPNWRETFGFDLLQLKETLTVGDPQKRLTYLRGDYQPQELELAGSGRDFGRSPCARCRGAPPGRCPRWKR